MTHAYPWASKIVIRGHPVPMGTPALLQIAAPCDRVARVAEGLGQRVSWAECSRVRNLFSLLYGCDYHCLGRLGDNPRRCPDARLIFAI